jgi:hypothetical protein
MMYYEYYAVDGLGTDFGRVGEVQRAVLRGVWGIADASPGEAGFGPGTHHRGANGADDSNGEGERQRLLD